MSKPGFKQNELTLRRKGSFITYIKKEWLLYAFLFPGIVLAIIFKYIPMYGIVIAFQDFNIFQGFFGSPWVGLKHLDRFLNDPYFFRLLRNTVLLNVFHLLFVWWQPIALALLLNELKNKRFKKTTQTISYLPFFISTVIVIGLTKQILSFNGPVNTFISSLGYKEIQFFSDPRFFRAIYLSTGAWSGIGFASIIYLAALSSISIELYEAAIIDGATRLQRAWHITIPGILPTITILFILNLGGMIAVGFEKVFLLQNPLNLSTADVFSTYVYRQGIANARYSYAAMVDLFNSLVGFALVVAGNQISKKISETSLW